MPIDQLQTLMMNQSFELKVKNHDYGFYYKIYYDQICSLNNKPTFDPKFDVSLYRWNGDDYELIAREVITVEKFEVEWKKYHKDDLKIKVCSIN